MAAKQRDRGSELGTTENEKNVPPHCGIGCRPTDIRTTCHSHSLKVFPKDVEEPPSHHLPPFCARGSGPQVQRAVQMLAGADPETSERVR